MMAVARCDWDGGAVLMTAADQLQVRSFIVVEAGFDEDQADQQKGFVSGCEAVQYAQSPAAWWRQLEYRTPEFTTCV